MSGLVRVLLNVGVQGDLQIVLHLAVCEVDWVSRIDLNLVVASRVVQIKINRVLVAYCLICHDNLVAFGPAQVITISVEVGSASVARARAVRKVAHRGGRRGGFDPVVDICDGRCRDRPASGL